MWNPKMVESTGIPETEACGNHVATFLLTSAEQQKVVELMHLALETGLTQQATVHLSCYDGANRCCVNMTLCPSLYPENEYLAAFCYERGSVEIRNDCVQWTVRSLKAHIAKLPKSPALNKVKETVDKLEKVTGRHAARSWGVVVLSNLLGKLKTHNLKSAKALGVDLIFSAVPEDIPTEVETDVQHMPLILGYLIHNALRHSKPGQQVIVSVSKMVETFVPFSQPGEARMSGSTSDGLRATTLLAFHVEDSGPGIAEDVLEKVKACVVDGGIEDVDGERGFGLVTTGLLIAECGGTLELLSSTDESDPVNSGTTAIVSIPLIVNTKDDITTQADTEMPAGGPGQGLKAMVIQPNAVTRSALCHYLWNKKYAVSVASVMDDAPDFSNIDVLITNTEDNDFTDDFFENIKTPHLHLVLTAYQPTADFKKLLSDNGVFLLPLPLQPLQVAQVLARVEESVSKAKAERDRIENIRRAFRVEETGSCPWERKRKLGTGAFGDVYEAIDRITKGTMAVKILRVHNKEEELINEVQLMSKLQHPNIIHYFHSQLECNSEGTNQVLIFMEFADGGSLLDVVQKQGIVGEERASQFIADIIKGVAYLHSQNVIHRDIKTANILIVNRVETQEQVCKVTDFGTAKELAPIESGAEGDGLARSLKGTPNFMAPEVMNEEPYDSKADVWSIGCVLLELVTGKPPFSHISENPWNVIRYVCSLKVSTDPDNPTPVNYGTAKLLQVIVIFLQATVMVNPADRLPCTELSNQPFVSHLNGGGQRYRDLLRGCKRASLGGTANRATPARVTFGDKWGENNQQKDEEPREEVGKDDASDFSGWGSDGDDKVEEEQPHLHPGGDASTSGNKSRFARWRASFEGHPLPLENWQGLDS
ncbi:Serine/threonine-protein kinase ATG1c [Diplonema papillatum]|nr:Serine/threonine-protein kinase ATG1c [Diplonema papillatum]